MTVLGVSTSPPTVSHCERGTGAAPADGREEADQMERRLASCLHPDGTGKLDQGLSFLGLQAVLWLQGTSAKAGNK